MSANSERRLLVASCQELVAGLAYPVVVVDVAERVSYVNPAAAVAFAQPRDLPLVGQVCCGDSLFGRGSYVHVANGPREPVDGWSVRDDLDRGVEVKDRTLIVDNPRSGRRQFSLDIIPLHTDFGGLAGVALVFRDETEQAAARSEGEWLRTELMDSRARVEHQLSRSRLLQTVAVAASSAVDLAEIASAVLNAIARERPLSAGALLSADDDKQLSVLASHGLSPEEIEGLYGAARESGSALLVEAVSEDRLVTSDELGPELVVHAESTQEIGYREVAVPIKYRGRLMGALLLGFRSRDEIEPEELDTLRAISDVLGQAIENARLYETEHHVAQTLQETLVVLPANVPGVCFSRAYESATYESGWVGGDFVDIFQVSENLVGITLGDVSGKGIDAAVTTSTIRTTLRVHALDGRPPAEIAKKANEVMRRFSDVDSFVTLWFGLLNTKTGRLRYVCAGHPPALVLSQGGELRELPCHDPILGAFDEATFFESLSVLAPGDRLVLYSDGVTEARAPDGQFLDSPGLLALLRDHAEHPVEELAPSLMREVVQFSDGVLRDDSAILAVSIKS